MHDAAKSGILTIMCAQVKFSLFWSVSVYTGATVTVCKASVDYVANRSAVILRTLLINVKLLANYAT